MTPLVRSVGTGTATGHGLPPPAAVAGWEEES